MRTLLHNLLSPATWKANLSSLLVHAGVLASCLALLISPVEQTSFSGRRNAVRLEMSLEPVPPQATTQPVSLELVEPLEITPIEPPQQARAASLAPQPTSVLPQPPLPFSVVQLTDARLDVFEAAPELGPPTPPRRQTATPNVVQLPTTRQEPTPFERQETQPTPPQPAAVAAIQEIAGVDDRTPPDFSHNPAPAYPRQAVQSRQEGTVLLELHVSETGHVQRVELLRSSGHTVLDRAAIEAVERWQGQPAFQGETAVSTVEQLQIRFIL